MGLTAERTMSMHEQSQMAGEEHADIEDEGRMDMDATLADGEALDEDIIKEVVRMANDKVMQRHNAMEDLPPVITGQELASRKRRKVIRTDKVSDGIDQHSHSPSTAGTTKVEGVPDHKFICAVTQEDVDGGAGENGLDVLKVQSTAAVNGNLTSKHHGRKRQLSASHSKATESTATSRAKRQDTKKSERDAKSTVKTAAASRPSRSCKE